jgi:hypothetical protein
MIGSFITKRKLALAGVGAAVSLAAIACGTDDGVASKGDAAGSPTPTAPPATGSIQSGYDAVRQSLQAEGAVIVRLDEAKEGIFKNPYVEVLVNGERVELYEFASVADAFEASLKVSDDGMMVSDGDGPPVAIDFQGKPHYYLQGNVIVVYTGDDQEVAGLLRSRLGDEFAGDKGAVSDPTGPLPDYDTAVVDAPIDNVYITTDPDNPYLYIMYVTSGLPSGCAKFEDWSVDRVDDETFKLNVLNRVPAPYELVACTEIYGINKFIAVIGEAGKDLEVCEVYRVAYNQNGEEKALRFQAISPTARCADPGVELDYGKPDPDDDGGSGQTLISDVHALLISLQALGIDAHWGDGDQEGSDLFGFDSDYIVINGQRVDVWAFGPGSSAWKHAMGVAQSGYSITLPNGTVMSPFWVSTPHFYLFGNAIVMYVGLEDDVISALDSVGQKFAGPGSKPLDTPIPVEPDGGIGDGAGPIVDPADGGGEDGMPAPDVESDRVLAPVVSVSPVFMTKSLPPQYLLTVRTAQPDGCSKDAGYEVQVVGDKVIIDVFNTVPAHPEVVLCLMIYGETDNSINLGSDFEASVEYTLVVNGEEQGTFVGV